MDPTANSPLEVDAESGTAEQRSESEGGESFARPSLSQVRKSWGFRRTTIAKREFMEEVGEITNNPPVVRKGRSRKSNQNSESVGETSNAPRTTTRSVLDDLQWSAPSSPLSEDSKTASESSIAVTLDPSLWQDFGSAFHTAFSLLGGNEDLPLPVINPLPDSVILETTDVVQESDAQPSEEMEICENLKDVDITQPVLPGIVAEEEDDVVVISSKEEDSDGVTLTEIKTRANSRGSQAEVQGGNSGRGRARGRGRGRGKRRGKSKGRGKGRGRAVERLLVSSDDDDSNNDIIFISGAEMLDLQEVNDNLTRDPAEEAAAPPLFDSLIPSSQLSSELVILEGELNQRALIEPSQFDDAPDKMEVEEGEKETEIKAAFSSISDIEKDDSFALCRICCQKHNKSFMINCSRCQDWFHVDCAGLGKTQEIEREEEFTCPNCTTNGNQLVCESDCSLPHQSAQSPLTEEGAKQEEEQTPEDSAAAGESEQASTNVQAEPGLEPFPEMEADASFALCTGPGCFKPALPDSVYCGNDCILQHAAVTMKTMTGPKTPKSKGRGQKKVSTTKPAATAQKAVRMSKRLAVKALEEAEKEMTGGDETEQEAASSSKTCDPSPTDVQSTSIPSNLHATSGEANETIEADQEDASFSKQNPDDHPIEPIVQPTTVEAPPPENPSLEKTNEPESSDVSNEQIAESSVSTLAALENPHISSDVQSPTTPAPRHHETGALIVTKTSYVIPKKTPESHPPPAHKSASHQKPSVPGLLNETHNLPVSPAPSAPSSRPSQPNNQVRQSIQRSLTSILYKRVCECEDLEMSESEATKFVAGIETEMFDIFRNTDSKYMNKYRTIMFNLKDARNKGLLYRVVNGEISPFRLVRMSQKDMQATKAPEPNPAKTTEVKDGPPKVTLEQKLEVKKVDLPVLSLGKPDRKPDAVEQRKMVPPPPPPPLKLRPSRPSQESAVPDIFSCMLKDTTSEHKSHLFDLKCKICTGQILTAETEEPARKKAKTSLPKDKPEASLKKSVSDESPVQIPTASPETDSPAPLQMDPYSSPSLGGDSPKLTIVESPTSLLIDSPASPMFESPASPTMESPASPKQETTSTSTAPKKYTPVVIPAVSTVTITRRDPRTALSRLTSSSVAASGPTNTTQKPAGPCTSSKETTPSQFPLPSPIPTPKPLPKSILTKPSSTADPRLYGSSSRPTLPKHSIDGETSQFLTKQDTVWKGFLNMLTVSKFATKAYLVSGPAENLKADLPDTIQIGGRILPATVWDYVEKLKTSVTKELSVIRFHPATDEEEVAYVSLFSYFNSRGRFGVVANVSRSIKDIYLVPLSAKESIPAKLQPLKGPGFEKKRPNLLLGLAIVQKAKRPGSLPLESEEKRAKISLPKDPTWIPKPPVLYGSDKPDAFQPHDPEMPVNVYSPGSPPSPQSLAETCYSSATVAPIKITPSADASTESSSNSNSAKNTTQSGSEKTPLQSILNSLFRKNQPETTTSVDESSTKKDVEVKKIPGFSQVPGSMVDPIVQQYGQKSKIKQVEEEDNDFDRPYDPEEEYHPTPTFTTLPPPKPEKMEMDSTLTETVEDDVAYDPEDETLFVDMQSGVTETKPPLSIQMPDSPSPRASDASTIQTSTPTTMLNLPTGTIIISAETLSEQQRMLEELNKQIEEQKRQLKEQEEALRQQREAVGMFMAQFSVSDSLTSPTKILSQSQVSSLHTVKIQQKSQLESTAQANNPTGIINYSNKDSKAFKLEDTSGHDLKNEINTTEAADKTPEKVEEQDKHSSTGEIGDSDVAYDPEDESLFDEIQDDVFKGGSTNSGDLLAGTGSKGASPTLYQSRKRRSSPKRRSRHDKEYRRSPSRRSQHRSRSHSRRRRDRDRHRRSESDRSKHRTRESSERQGHRHRHLTSRQHGHGRRSSPSPQKKSSVSLSPKHDGEIFPQGKNELENDPCNVPFSVVGKSLEAQTSPSPVLTIKNDPDEPKLESSAILRSEKLPLKLIDKVKTEISEQTVSDHKSLVSNSFTQAKKPPLLESFVHDKYENSLPLREIDPPLRDSPESPDPEPPFSKPFSTENNLSIKTEDNGLSTEKDTALSVASVNNNSLVVNSEATMHFTAINLDNNLQGQQSLLKTDHKIMVGAHSSPLGGLFGQTSWPKDDVAVMPPGTNKSCAEIGDQQGSLKTSGLLQVDIKQTNDRYSGNVDMPKMWESSESFKDKDEGNDIIKKSMQVSEFKMKGPGNLHKDPHRTLSWSSTQSSEISQKEDVQVPSFINPVPDMVQKVDLSVSYLSVAESGTQIKPEKFHAQTFLSDTSSANSMPEKKDTMEPLHEEKQDQKTTGPHQCNLTVDSNSHRRNPDFKRSLSPLVIQEDCQSSEKRADSFRPGTSTKIEGSNDQTQNQGSSTANQVSDSGAKDLLEYQLPESSTMQNPADQSGDLRGKDLIRQQPEWRCRDIQFPGHEMKGAEQRVNSDFNRQEPRRTTPETKFPNFEKTGPKGAVQNSERLVSPMRPGFDRQHKESVGSEPERRPIGPSYGESGSMSKGSVTESYRNDNTEASGQNFREPGPNRRGPDMVCSRPSWRDPKSEGPGTDRRGPRGREFREQVPLKGLQTDRKGPGDLDFKSLGHDRGNISLEGPHGRGRGHPVFRDKNRFMPIREREQDDTQTVGSEPGSRCPMRGPKIDRSSGCPDFRSPNYGMERSKFDRHSPERQASRGSDFRGSGPEWKAPGEQNSGRQAFNRKRPYMVVGGCNFPQQDSDRTNTGVEGSGQNMRQREPHPGVEMAEGSFSNMQRFERSCPDYGGPGPEMACPPPNSRGRVGIRMARQESRHAAPHLESQHFSRREAEGSKIRESGQHRLPQNMKETEHNRNFPSGPEFRYSESRRILPHIENPQTNTKPQFRGGAPDRSRSGQWASGKGSEGDRMPYNQSGNSNWRDPAFNRQHREENTQPDMQYSEIEGRESEWREFDGRDYEGPDMIQEGLNVEGLWQEEEWKDSKSIQNNQGSAVQEFDRGRGRFRARGHMRRNIRPGPNVWGYAPADSGTSSEEQWTDNRLSDINAPENENQCSEDNWVGSEDWNSAPTQDDPNQHGQEHCDEWQNYEGHVPEPIHNRPNVQFRGSRNGRGNGWNRPGGRDSDSVQERSDLACTSADFKEPENEWREVGRGEAGAHFKEERYLGTRGRNYFRGRVRARGRGRGLGMQRPSEINHEWGQQDFQEDMRSPNVDEYEAHRKGTENPCSDWGDLERERFERRGPRGPDLRHQRPVSDETFTNYRDQGSEGHGEDPRPGRRGFGRVFRRASRAPRMRQRPSTADRQMTSSNFSHQTGAWETNQDFPESDGGRLEMGDGEHGQIDQSGICREGSHQAAEFQDSRNAQLPFFNRSGVPGPNRGGKSFPAFERQQNPPPRRRGGLLPTPTKGPQPFPSHVIRNHDSGHPPNADPRRGRPTDMFRGCASGRGRGYPAGNVRTVGEEERC